MTCAYSGACFINVAAKSRHKKILKLARTDADKQKVKLILNELFPNSDAEVPDPYFGGESGFEDVYKLLDEATDRIIEKYKDGK